MNRASNSIEWLINLIVKSSVSGAFRALIRSLMRQEAGRQPKLPWGLQVHTPLARLIWGIACSCQRMSPWCWPYCFADWATYRSSTLSSFRSHVPGSTLYGPWASPQLLSHSSCWTGSRLGRCGDSSLTGYWCGSAPRRNQPSSHDCALRSHRGILLSALPPSTHELMETWSLVRCHASSTHRGPSRDLSCAELICWSVDSSGSCSWAMAFAISCYSATWSSVCSFS